MQGILEDAVQHGKAADKHLLIANHVREKIQSREYRDKLPPMRQLAAEYGVNYRTVIGALDALCHDGFIYRTERSGTFVTARHRPRTHTLAVVLGGSSIGSLHARLVTGMQQEATRHGQTLLLKSNIQYQLGQEVQQEARAVDIALSDHEVDGVVLWPTLPNYSSPAVQALSERGMPFIAAVSIDVPAESSFSYVMNDDERGARAAIDHLIGKGHKKICMLQPSDPSAVAEKVYFSRRRDGYARSMLNAGLSAAPPLVAPWDFFGNLDATKEKAFVRNLLKYSAVFCATDSTAAHLVGLLLRIGIRVPRDLAIVGFDDIDVAQPLGLTTVNQQMEKIGARAVELLLEEIEGKRSAPAQEMLKPELVVRDSTAGRTG